MIIKDDFPLKEVHIKKKKKKSQGKFFWSDGRTVGQGQSQGNFFLVGRSDGGWQPDGSFYFALEPPNINTQQRNIKNGQKIAFFGTFVALSAVYKLLSFPRWLKIVAF